MASGREQYLQALASLSDLTRTQAERVAALLAKQGEVQSAQVGRVAEDLMRRTQKNRETMSRLVQREVKRQLGVLGMATRDEVARLQQRVRALEQEVERASKAAAPAPRRPRRRSGTTRSRDLQEHGHAGEARDGQALDPDPHRRGEHALDGAPRPPPAARRTAPGRATPGPRATGPPDRPGAVTYTGRVVAVAGGVVSGPAEPAVAGQRCRRPGSRGRGGARRA